MWQAVSGQTLSSNPTIAYELAVSRIARSPVWKLTWFSVAESMVGNYNASTLRAKDITKTLQAAARNRGCCWWLVVEERRLVVLQVGCKH
jgi:hypothetical protein